MSWHLTIRALCIVAYIAAFGSFFAAACFMDDQNRVAARRWTAYGFGFAILGCILIGFGWTEAHP